MRAETLHNFLADCLNWQNGEVIYTVPYPSPRIYERIADYVGLDDMGFITMRHVLRIEKLAHRHGIILPPSWHEIRAAALRRANYRTYMHAETGECITLCADWRNPDSEIQYRFDDYEFQHTPFTVRDCRGIPRRALRLVFPYADKMLG